MVMTNYRTDIGTRLSKVRIENSMTQESLAEKCGISLEYYRLIEKGLYLPNVNSINCIHELNWDVDYILTGIMTKESVFSEYLEGVTEARRNNICNLLIYQMKKICSDSKYEGKSSELFSGDTMIRDSEYMSYTPNERIKEIVLSERGYTEFKVSDFAKDLGISEKTVGRWLSGKSKLKTEMILSVYNKYHYFPSYILYGELNSNSKCDLAFRELSEEDKNKVINFATALITFI